MKSKIIGAFFFALFISLLLTAKGAVAAGTPLPSGFYEVTPTPISTIFPTPVPTQPPTPSAFPTPTAVNYQTSLRLNNENFNDTYLKTDGVLPTITNELTVEAWIKVPRPSGGNYIRVYPIAIYNKPQAPGDYGYIFKLNMAVDEVSGVIRPSFSFLKNSFSTVNSNYVNVDSPGPLSPDTWHHVAGVVYSNQDYCYSELYINGTRVNFREVYSPACTINVQNPINMTVGKPESGAGGISGFYYNGLIDSLRISNVRRYTNSNSTLPNPNLTPDANTLALYHFEQNLNDSSINRMNLSAVGSRYSYESSTSPSPSPVTPQSIGDANGDFLVDGTDFAIWLSHFDQNLSGPGNGDFNQDSRVDGVDYMIWVNTFGGNFIPTPSPTATPSLSMLYPNGGEVWTRGQTYQISWNEGATTASTGLYIYTRSGSIDTPIGAIAYNVPHVSGNNTYAWTIPPLGGSQTSPPDGPNIILSVVQYDANGTRVSEDKSDNVFTIYTAQTVPPSPTPIPTPSCINTTCYMDADGDGFRSTTSASRCVAGGNCANSPDSYNKNSTATVECNVAAGSDNHACANNKCSWGTGSGGASGCPSTFTANTACQYSSSSSKPQQSASCGTTEGSCNVGSTSCRSFSGTCSSNGTGSCIRRTNFTGTFYTNCLWSGNSCSRINATSCYTSSASCVWSW